MEFLAKIAAYIQNLEHKQFKNYLLMSLLGVACAAGGIVYYIQLKNIELINKFKQVQSLTEKAYKIIADNRAMVKDEKRFKEQLDNNKDFTIQSFFEQFCREQSLTPEPNWNPRSEEVNEKFDEITLPATFKGLTSDKLVQVLDALDKKEIVYIKELTLRKEEASKITCDIIIATKKYKSFSE